MDFFTQYFDLAKKNQILKNFNSPSYSSVKIIIEVLKHNCISIIELYNCFLKCELREAADFLEKICLFFIYFFK